MNASPALHRLSVWLSATLALVAMQAACAQSPATDPLAEPAESSARTWATQATTEPPPAPGAARIQPDPQPNLDADATAIDPPGRVGRLSLIEGEVSLSSAPQTASPGAQPGNERGQEWTEAVLNRPLTSGDTLWVDRNARAELQTGSATIHLDQETSFGFIRLDDDVMQMSLTEGAATVRVRRLAERETVQVETPNASVVLRHPGEYHLQIDSSGDRTIVKVRSGEAEVTGGTRAYVVRAGETGSFSGLDALAAQIDPIAPRTAFESWANERDRRDRSSRSARYVSRDVVGYEDLDDNGEWIVEPEYGYVWRPLYVASGWAPYRYGHWSWISPWGWTWIDDARWGFAPFHYGRWARVRNRWCWVPGPRHLRPVYAPALVGWTGGPSIGVSLSFGRGVGWFPLAPHELYIPGYRHTPRYIRHVNRSNTFVIHRRDFNDIYATRPDRRNDRRDAGDDRRIRRDYRYAHQSDAVTIARPGQFVRSHPGRDTPKHGGDFVRVRPRTPPAGVERSADTQPPTRVRPTPPGSRLNVRQQNELNRTAERLQILRSERDQESPRQSARDAATSPERRTRSIDVEALNGTPARGEAARNAPTRTFATPPGRPRSLDRDRMPERTRALRVERPASRPDAPPLRSYDLRSSGARSGAVSGARAVPGARALPSRAEPSRAMPSRGAGASGSRSSPPRAQPQTPRAQPQTPRAQPRTPQRAQPQAAPSRAQPQSPRSRPNLRQQRQ